MTMYMPAFLGFLLLAACDGQVSDAPADADPPSRNAENYYAGIDAQADGEQLKSQLHDLIDDHQLFEYHALWEALAYTDADPDRPGEVVLFYTGWSRSADRHGGERGDWNREHVWPKSRGQFGNAPGPGTDLHQVHPTDVRTNGARGNLAFDDGGALWEDTGCRRDEDSFEPRAKVKGDVARAIFYLAVRYEGPGLELDLELIDLAPAPTDKAPVHGVLSTLIQWHKADPPDDWERRRNDRVQALQGNRNPFIDRPEWVEKIWAEGSDD